MSPPMNGDHSKLLASRKWLADLLNLDIVKIINAHDCAITICAGHDKPRILDGELDFPRELNALEQLTFLLLERNEELSDGYRDQLKYVLGKPGLSLDVEAIEKIEGLAELKPFHRLPGFIRSSKPKTHSGRFAAVGS